jgi:hypothetical protein
MEPILALLIGYASAGVQRKDTILWSLGAAFWHETLPRIAANIASIRHYISHNLLLRIEFFQRGNASDVAA